MSPAVGKVVTTTLMRDLHHLTSHTAMPSIPLRGLGFRKISAAYRLPVGPALWVQAAPRSKPYTPL